MTPEQLKASILQYAIQGKLVEQRPEEGTGEELYQQMQTDKQTLIREKKIKKEKPLPDIIDDEIPFDVPESWKWVKVGNVGSWSSGATPSRTNPAYYGGSIPWLKTGDLNDGFIQEVPEYITDLALEKTSLRLNPIGSVLMAMYGATIGKLGILEIPVTTNQACCACIPYAGMNNKYLFYYLMSMRQSYIGMAEGGAQPNISKEKIVNSLIPLPPAEEQRRIVAKIEELLPYVDCYAAAYEKLEQFNAKFPEDMKKSILQYAIQGKLVEQRPEEGTGKELYQQIQTEKQRLIKKGKIKKEKPLPKITEDELPFDIPESWKWCRLSDVIDVRDGTHDSPKYVPVGIPLVTSKLYFSSANYYDDPFDTFLHIDIEAIRKEYLSAFQTPESTEAVVDGVKSLLGNILSEEQAAQFTVENVTNALSHGLTESFLNAALSLRDEVKKDTWSVCFSENGFNEVLWLKYADQHRGFVQIYDLENNDNFLCGKQEKCANCGIKNYGTPLYPIYYSDTPYDATKFAKFVMLRKIAETTATQIPPELYAGMGSALWEQERTTLIKKECHKYDEEWRMITGCIMKPPVMMEWIPSGIILGLRMGVAEENLVVSMAKEAGIKNIYKSYINAQNKLDAYPLKS